MVKVYIAAAAPAATALADTCNDIEEAGAEQGDRVHGDTWVDEDNDARLRRGVALCLGPPARIVTIG